MLLRPAIALLAILGLVETHVSAATLPGTRTGIQKRVPSGTRRRRNMDCYVSGAPAIPPGTEGLQYQFQYKYSYCARTPAVYLIFSLEAPSFT
jgi:hypothetical protein